MDTPEAKIFGIERSGTNWLYVLLKKNYHVDLLGKKGGHKHYPYQVPEILGRDVNMIVASKHPLTWLPSVWRWYRQEKTTLSPHQPVSSAGDSLQEFLSVHSRQVIEKWNSLYRSHLETTPGDKQKAIVRYEALLADPVAECNKISSAFNLPRRKTPFYIPSKHMGTQNNETKRAFDAAWYLLRKFRGLYSLGEIGRVRAMVDNSAALGLGYSEEDWN